MKIYDLEVGTEKFSLATLLYCKSLPSTAIMRPLINQLIRSATSVGANYREANGAISRKDFSNKIHICKKEAKETVYWLGLLEKLEPNHKKEACSLGQEAQELVLIFAKIASSSRER